MWGIEHTAMIIAFAGLAAGLAFNRQWSWLFIASLSQIPFWGGYVADAIYSNPSPSTVNIILNVMVAGAFATIAEKLQALRRGGIVCIWLCILFLIMASVDVVHLIAPFDSYFSMQEFLHYLALLVIGGRVYVKRTYSTNGDLVHSPNIGKGKDLA